MKAKELMLAFAIISILSVTGCHKNRDGSISIPGLIPNPHAPVTNPSTILIMGQSNALRLNPDGYKGWNTVRYNQGLPGDTFINCAENGTTMAQWDPHGARFANCVALTQGKHIDAILWFQGESDANPSIGGSASDYAQKAVTLFSFMRTQWGCDVPIIYAQIAVIGPSLVAGFPNWQQVKDQQASIFYPTSAMIKTDDIVAGGPLTNDDIHFNDQGYYEIGARFARAFLGIGTN